MAMVFLVLTAVALIGLLVILGFRDGGTAGGVMAVIASLALLWLVGIVIQSVQNGRMESAARVDLRPGPAEAGHYDWRVGPAEGGCRRRSFGTSAKLRLKPPRMRGSGTPSL
ncbi:MAG: hypothetical protein HYX76_04930 [Acidobacteria bacterium]|nr:hypothetical protein [Acidobacteriota bacterium]